MGFYQDITRNYNIQTTRLMKQYLKTQLKLATGVNRRIFLLRCRSSGVIPTHLKNGRKNFEIMLFTNGSTTKVDNFINSLSKKTLSLEIKLTCNSISITQRRLIDIRLKLQNSLPPHIFNEYEKRVKQKFNFRFNKIKQRNLLKYDKLMNTNTNDQQLFKNNTKWFKNISKVEIPKDVSDFLSLGPKFSVPGTYKDISVGSLLAEIENIIDEIPDNSKDILRARATNVVTNFFYKSKFEKPHWLSRIFKKSKEFLKAHPEIYILQSDKGGCTVAMDRNEYIHKTETLLQDETTYTLLCKDPTSTIQTSFNDLIKFLKNKGEIDEQLYKKLIIYNSTFPKLYCLPKIHKVNTPLRPIVSSVNSTTYNLSKYLANILSVAFDNDTDYNVRDTFSFVNKIKGLTLPENYVLISLDVVSLFTNIPLDLVLTILEKKWELIQTKTMISKHNFLILIKFIFNNTYFSFNQKFFKQTFGTPMGSPISPILARVVLDHLLETVVPQLPFNLPFLYKYVDDLVCAVPRVNTENILNYFNAFNTHIQFTLEVEQDLSVPFLDTKVIRTSDNSIILDWYKKPTASGRFINYFSNHPKNQKFNTVIAMKNRVIRISDDRFRKRNLDELYNIFINNAYPKHILRKLIYNSDIVDAPTNETPSQHTMYRKLQFIEPITNSIIALFKDFPNIKIAKYNSKQVSELFSKIKDRTPILYNNCVVYRLSCLQCEACYIGQTAQWLKQRLTQHRSDCRLGKNSCAVVQHHLKTGHSFDYNNVKILTRDNNYKGRLFKEMYHINKDPKSINYKSDTNQLSSIYSNIINNY